MVRSTTCVLRSAAMAELLYGDKDVDHVLLTVRRTQVPGVATDDTGAVRIDVVLIGGIRLWRHLLVLAERSDDGQDIDHALRIRRLLLFRVEVVPAVVRVTQPAHGPV